MYITNYNYIELVEQESMTVIIFNVECRFHGLFTLHLAANVPLRSL